MTTPIERYAWRSLVIIPVIAFVVAVKGLMSGAPSNPALVAALTGLDWAELRAQQPVGGGLRGVLLAVTVLTVLGLLVSRRSFLVPGSPST